MKNHRATYSIILIVTLAAVAQQVRAQQTGDDFKRQLKKSLGSSSALEMKPEFKYQNPQQTQQYNSDVLKVSPTTKLPTKYDRVVTNEPVSPEEIAKLEKDIEEQAFEVKDPSQPARAAINYSDGKVHEVPDARSKLQWAQHTRNDYDLGIYTDESSPEWLVKLRNTITPKYRNIDLDPVRTIQNMKARKRKEKVDKIKQAYGQ